MAGPSPSAESEPQSAGLGIAAEALGARLPALMVAAQRVAETVAPGTHGRRRVGLGESFWQFRPYQTGDTVDGIDWRQSAKGDRLYIRETEWAAAQTVWLWRDSNPGMDFRSERRLPTKQERTDLLVMALANLLARGGERIGLLGGSSLPSTGRGALPIILAGLNNTPPLAQIKRQAARHSTLVMFGDFLDPLDEIARSFDRAATAGVMAQIVQVLDPTEIGLGFNGRVRFREMAEGTTTEDDVLIPRVEAVRTAYQQAMQRQQDGLAALARTRGWEFIVHTTDQPAEDPLRTLFSRLAIRRGDPASGQS